ncbi:hypothetical protein N1031_05775 [Herbiconiux moechotypicola]|uniref:Integral membrane protein n=1 Tax=Herbiconiux moechotypicola TaxID=637393 RepID=A0ABN3DE55_9MICO|nr:hypothetical protein [Herbiconiux moechotypicola]MCS5729264.1 hypothetical protein [Herbiconiux moechotypicola]
MARRPAGVTLVAVIVWIQGLFTLLGGIFSLVAAPAGGELAGPLAASAIISIILGVITIAVGVGLLRGSGVARVLTTIVLLLSIANAIYVLLAQPATILGPVVSALLAVVGLIMLYTSRANAYFRS